jgi:hypothetical protein
VSENPADFMLVPPSSMGLMHRANTGFPIGGSAKHGNHFHSSEHGDRGVSILHMPERISNTNETQESYFPAAAPVAGSINNIYALVTIENFYIRRRHGSQNNKGFSNRCGKYSYVFKVHENTRYSFMCHLLF